jgi:hypothetical protein
MIWGHRLNLWIKYWRQSSIYWEWWPVRRVKRTWGRRKLMKGGTKCNWYLLTKYLRVNGKIWWIGVVDLHVGAMGIRTCQLTICPLCLSACSTMMLWSMRL